MPGSKTRNSRKFYLGPPRGLLPEQLVDWLTDNNLTTRQFAEAVGVTLMTGLRWTHRTRKTRRDMLDEVPAYVHTLVRYFHRDLVKGKRGPQRCQCGCLQPTFFSVLTGYYNLFLPEHSRAWRERNRGIPKSARKPRVVPLAACPTCGGALRDGTFKIRGEGDRVWIGQLCTKCPFHHRFREAS